MHTLEVTNNYGIKRELEIEYVDTPSDRDEFGNDMMNGDFDIEAVYYNEVNIYDKLSTNYTDYLRDMLGEELLANR